MRSNEIAGALGSVFGPIVSFWRATIRAYRPCTLCWGTFCGVPLPVGVKRIIASEKRMLIVFWGIHGIVHYCWLPKDNILNSPFCCEEVFSPLAQKMQPNSKKLANP
jgi:hypothetical protein